MCLITTDRLSLPHRLFRIRDCDKIFVAAPFFVVIKEQERQEWESKHPLSETFIFLKFYLISDTIWNRMRR